MGVDDWVRVGEIAKIVRFNDRDLDEMVVMRSCLSTLEELLGAGFADIGELGEGGFKPWASSVTDSLRSVEQKWISLGHPLGVDDLNIWLSNTSQGDELGREYAPLFQDDDDDV